MEFEKELPDAFRKPLSTKVVLIKSAKNKRVEKKNGGDGYNTNVIFSHVLLLLCTNQIEYIFDFELAAVPWPLFNEAGETRYPKIKSVLMNKLKVIESRQYVKADSMVIDGGEMLHVIDKALVLNIYIQFND